MLTYRRAVGLLGRGGTSLRKLQRLFEYGRGLFSPNRRRSLGIGNLVTDDLILCNFCGTVFKRSGPDHSEWLQCPFCDSIARERVMYQCILDEMSRRTGTPRLFISQAYELRRLALLECSPRLNSNRRKIYETTFGRYAASDNDMRAHRGDLRIDLTDDHDVSPLAGAFDIVICSHVLEHVPDYSLALENLSRLLARGGFMVLQVPLLESAYVKVTWDEFHADSTRVYHRFGFDLLESVDRYFSEVRPIVGLLDFEIASPEIKPGKYDSLKSRRERVTILGESRLRYNGLGSPDLCDAFVAYK